jgi:hypothetical protein
MKSLVLFPTLAALIVLSACGERVPAVGFAGDECSTLQAACAGGSAIVTCDAGVYVEAIVCAQELCTEEFENDTPRVCCENAGGDIECIGTEDKSIRCVGDACNFVTG